MAEQRVIDHFSGDYRWLSNFYMSPVSYEGRRYPSVEHAYQAAKTTKLAERKKFALLRTAGEAKRAGRKVTLRTGWEGMKVGVMLELLRFKFREFNLREKLKATGDALLVEGNDWGDRYWGVCRGNGQNWLGKLLMKVREEVVKEDG
jgi:ribA/ribD-fused uncharacterized protein